MEPRRRRRPLRLRRHSQVRIEPTPQPSVRPVGGRRLGIKPLQIKRQLSQVMHHSHGSNDIPKQQIRIAHRHDGRASVPLAGGLERLDDDPSVPSPRRKGVAEQLGGGKIPLPGRTWDSEHEIHRSLRRHDPCERLEQQKRHGGGGPVGGDDDPKVSRHRLVATPLALGERTGHAAKKRPEHSVDLTSEVLLLGGQMVVRPHAWTPFQVRRSRRPRPCNRWCGACPMRGTVSNRQWPRPCEERGHCR